MSIGEATAAREDLPQIERRRIPYDYAFRFPLRGQPDLVHRQTVTVSIEASFVAVSIGYGVVPAVPPVRFGVPRKPYPYDRPTRLRDITFGDAIEGLVTRINASVSTGTIGPDTRNVLADGLKLNPALVDLVARAGLDGQLDGDALDELFQAVAAPADRIQFLYALFDDGSGREFQSEPILNIAGLGISDGDRPFRYFAKPIDFRPMSRIRMDVIEVSSFKGDLHVSLQGYKMLGGAGTPTGDAARRAMEGAPR